MKSLELSKAEPTSDTGRPPLKKHPSGFSPRAVEESRNQRKTKRQIMQEEVANFEKALSEDEVKRMMLDEGLTENQRCLILLKKPGIDQQSYMFRNCRAIFKDNE